MVSGDRDLSQNSDAIICFKLCNPLYIIDKTILISFCCIGYTNDYLEGYRTLNIEIIISFSNFKIFSHNDDTPKII